VCVTLLFPFSSQASGTVNAKMHEPAISLSQLLVCVCACVTLLSPFSSQVPGTVNASMHEPAISLSQLFVCVCVTLLSPFSSQAPGNVDAVLCAGLFPGLVRSVMRAFDTCNVAEPSSGGDLGAEQSARGHCEPHTHLTALLEVRGVGRDQKKEIKHSTNR